MATWWKRYRGDITGGITVAIVALPLALAFGIASGAGAVAGLYAAIFAGFITSLTGSSGVQVSGPTGAMTVVLVTIIEKYGIQGMLLAGAMAGIMQILLGLLHLGSFVKYLPQAVISGFTNGIAVLIFLSQVKDARQAPMVAAVTILAIVLTQRYAKRFPASLCGLAAGIAFNYFLARTPFLVGPIPFHLPTLTLSMFPWGQWSELLMPAITICLLGSIEALLSAEVGDAIAGQQHDGNRELIGQGLGNMVSALVGGVPVTGAIARTAVNANSGGRTRFSGMLHSIVLLLVVVAFGRWAKDIPLASLAAILMVTAYKMVDWQSLALIPRARWTYTCTLLVTMVLTVIQDLTVAVAVGCILAGMFVIKELTSLPLVKERGHEQTHRQALPAVHADVQVFALTGPLFFISAAKLLREFEKVPQGRVVVLDLSHVPTIDETGAFMLVKLAQQLRNENRSLYLAGVRRRPLRLLGRLGLIDELGRSRVSTGIRVALRRASQEAAHMEEVA